jgi:glyoxylase-like metal-dependent hydrolase (beta-lactamase superfamily II)
MALQFNTAFDPAYGRAIDVAPKTRRLTAGNAGPFSFHGTNTYLVGERALAVIDPGPEDEAHLAAIMAAADNRPISHIFVSHTHRDHSPLAKRLKELTGAKTYAEGPHRPARPLHLGETNPLDSSGDTDFSPDVALADLQLVEGDGWALRAVHTPGHAANHVAFALEGTGVLFSADHVMGWSTTIVAPPDGAMADYMASLDRLIARDDTMLLPGHGGPVTEPRIFMQGLKEHRKTREGAIVERLAKGDRTIPEMVTAIYRDTDPRMHGAAGLSVLAHLEDLFARGIVETDGDPSIDGVYRLR